MSWLWPSMLVLLAGGITVGWHARRWLCEKTKGCPLYRRESARAWTDRLTKEYPDGSHEGHPTLISEEVWKDWHEVPPIDEPGKTGVSSPPTAPKEKP